MKRGFLLHAKNWDAEIQSARIRVRAELLRKAEKAKGARGAGRPSLGGPGIRPPKDDDAQTLTDLGISKGQSATGAAYQALRHAKIAADAIELSRRRDNLSWGHHRVG